MEAIILAGGMGTRLRTLVSDVPKPMADLNGKPFLEVLLNVLAEKGFVRIILAVGYMGSKIQEHFGKTHKGMEIVYVFEEKPLGTGGGLRSAMRKMNDNHVFVFNGDTFLDLETDLVEYTWKMNKQPIIVTRRVSDCSRYGRIIKRNEYLFGFEERGTRGAGLINAGCYVLNKGFLDPFSLGYEFSFEKEILQNKEKSSQFLVFESHGFFIDIGVPDDYILAKKLMGKWMIS